MNIEIGAGAQNAINWIEEHEHTVELLKWAVVGALVWWSGILGALSDWSKRPTLKVDEYYSHFFFEHHVMLGKHSDQVLIVVLADLGIINPTTHRIGIVGFDMSIRRLGLLRRWLKATKAIGFPAPYTLPMPQNMVKIIPIWFTHFPTGPDDPGLGRTGADPQDSTSAMTMFVVALDKGNARHLNGTLPVKIRAHLATGRTCTFIGVLGNKLEMGKLDSRIEGGLDYARHPSVWTKIDKKTVTALSNRR